MCEGYAWESGSIGGTGKNYDTWKICFDFCSCDDSDAAFHHRRGQSGSKTQSKRPMNASARRPLVGHLRCLRGVRPQRHLVLRTAYSAEAETEAQKHQEPSSQPRAGTSGKAEARAQVSLLGPFGYASPGVAGPGPYSLPSQQEQGLTLREEASSARIAPKLVFLLSFFSSCFYFYETFP